MCVNYCLLYNWRNRCWTSHTVILTNLSMLFFRLRSQIYPVLSRPRSRTLESRNVIHIWEPSMESKISWNFVLFACLNVDMLLKFGWKYDVLPLVPTAYEYTKSTVSNDAESLSAYCKLLSFGSKKRFTCPLLLNFRSSVFSKCVSVLIKHNVIDTALSFLSYLI